jgi:hypothetical protein
MGGGRAKRGGERPSQKRMRFSIRVFASLNGGAAQSAGANAPFDSESGEAFTLSKAYNGNPTRIPSTWSEPAIPSGG